MSPWDAICRIVPGLQGHASRRGELERAVLRRRLDRIREADAAQRRRVDRLERRVHQLATEVAVLGGDDGVG